MKTEFCKRLNKLIVASIDFGEYDGSYFGKVARNDELAKEMKEFIKYIGLDDSFKVEIIEAEFPEGYKEKVYQFVEDNYEKN